MVLSDYDARFILSSMKQFSKNAYSLVPVLKLFEHYSHSMACALLLVLLRINLQTSCNDQHCSGRGLGMVAI